ncbi:DMT family transporter [Opitutales bacterium ASA1]|nr:DMT family transporter [Opitutales bacterium ASA1]
MLLFAVFACSTAAILIKVSTTHPTLLGALRLLIAAVLLAPLAWRDHRKLPGKFTVVHAQRIVWPAFVLAAHFVSWGFGARMTLSAQASLVVNLAPVALPFFLHALVGERITPREISGTVLALCGVLLLGARDAFVPGGDVWGNVVCFGSMLLFAWYLALGRRNRDFPTLWLYVVPVYAVAGAVCLVVSLPWIGRFEFASTREWMLIAGLAVVPTIVGHSLLNLSMRHLRGQVVSLCNVGQFVFAGALAWLLFDEVPRPIFYLASALVVAGVAMVVLRAPAQPRMR